MRLIRLQLCRHLQCFHISPFLHCFKDLSINSSNGCCLFPFSTFNINKFHLFWSTYDTVKYYRNWSRYLRLVKIMICSYKSWHLTFSTASPPLFWARWHFGISAIDVCLKKPTTVSFIKGMMWSFRKTEKWPLVVWEIDVNVVCGKRMKCVWIHTQFSQDPVHPWSPPSRLSAPFAILI